MATQKQHKAGKANIKKAQERWKSMSKTEHARTQPEGRNRQKPGTTGRGKYYRVIVRPKNEFSSFRIQDVGRKGHVERLAGRRPSGSWDTQAWLISKDDAHREGNKLVADSSRARNVLSKLAAVPKHVKGDVFRAKDRRNVSESEKPTAAQREAQMENIRKAQEKRW